MFWISFPKYILKHKLIVLTIFLLGGYASNRFQGSHLYNTGPYPMLVTQPIQYGGGYSIQGPNYLTNQGYGEFESELVLGLSTQYPSRGRYFGGASN